MPQVAHLWRALAAALVIVSLYLVSFPGHRPIASWTEAQEPNNAALKAEIARLQGVNVDFATPMGEVFVPPPGAPSDYGEESPDEEKTTTAHDNSPLGRFKVSRWLQTQAMNRHPKHWPPFDGYRNKNYDPTRWHFLDMREEFYTCTVGEHGRHPDLVAEPYCPMPISEGMPCIGPRGIRLNESWDDLVLAYKNECKEFPEPLFGSHKAAGLDDSVCFDRASRYGAYGLGHDDGVAVNHVDDRQPVDWNAIRWGGLQDQCLHENAKRFAPQQISARDDGDKLKAPLKDPLPVKRTAVVIRTWASYEYTPNDMQTIRSLVQELGLWGMGEYQVFLFVHVKDRTLPILTNSQIYKEVLEAHVPVEFRDIAILWNEDVCEQMYPAVGENSVYFQQFQPLQWFASQHPEFDYVWNWEMDVRYIGHHYHFLDTLAKFAADQPRKYLWERSSRFYIPRLHKTWNDFSGFVANAVPLALSIWGPQAALETELTNALVPAKPAVDDDFQAGRGEPADLIVLLPFFNPQDTKWVQRNKIWNYAQGTTTPRRAFVNTLARFSRRQLAAMHGENSAGRSMASEMWPATVALHHGLKAVYAPHPIWNSHEWPGDYANDVFNPGRAEAPGTWQDAVYSPDREHNFGGMSWYFWSMFPGTLYRRFLGWDVVDDEGKRLLEKPDEGRKMCLPGMLLHPAKKVKFQDVDKWKP